MVFFPNHNWIRIYSKIPNINDAFSFDGGHIRPTGRGVGVETHLKVPRLSRKCHEQDFHFDTRIICPSSKTKGQAKVNFQTIFFHIRIKSLLIFDVAEQLNKYRLYCFSFTSTWVANEVYVRGMIEICSFTMYWAV